MQGQSIPIFGTVEAAANFWMLMLGIWALSGVANVVIADLKGRNHFIWGLIGLFLGPFGVLIMALRVFKKKPSASENDDKVEDGSAQE